MKLITDSYYKNGVGKVTLSGESYGAPPIAEKYLAKITGGKCSVDFLPVSDYARALVKSTFDKEFSENPEAYVIEAMENTVRVYADTDRARKTSALRKT